MDEMALYVKGKVSTRYVVLRLRDGAATYWIKLKILAFFLRASEPDPQCMIDFQVSASRVEG